MLLCLAFILHGCGKTPEALLIYNEKTNFEYGENFSLGEDVILAVRYDDNTTSQISVGNLLRNSQTTFSNGEVTVDFSEYDKKTLGDYTIYIYYESNHDIKTYYYVSVTNSTKQVSYDVIGYTGFYDGKYKTLSFNLPEDDTISTIYSYDGVSYDQIECPKYKNVGVYKVYYKISRYGYPDYFGSENIEIKKIDLHVKPDNQEVTYGNEANFLNETFTCRGFVNDENEGTIDGVIQFTTNYSAGKNAGDYKIFASGLDSKNYNIIYDEGTLRVNKAINNLTVTFDNITYGKKFLPVVLANNGNGRLTYTYSVSGQNQFMGAMPTNVGSYDIKCTSAESTNYLSAETIINNVSIIPAKLYITPVANPIYYSDNFDYSTIYNTFEGFVNGDNVNSLETSPEGITYSTDYERLNPAGEYHIYISGYKSTNYDIINKTGILEVRKIENNLLIDFYSKTYDGLQLTPKIIRQPCSEPIKYSYIQDEQEYSGFPTNAGIYTIIVNQPESANYQGYYQEFYNIQIYKILLEIEWTETVFYYDGTPKCPQVICKNLLEGEEDVRALTKTENDCINSSITNYTAYCYEVTSPNYKLPASRQVNFYIYKQIVPTPVVEDIVYDGQNHNSGLSDNEVYTVKDIGNGITAGDHTVVLELNHPDNYVWQNSSDTILTFKYKILKADNVITYFEVPSWDYNDSPSEFIINLRYNDTTKNIVKKYKTVDAQNFSSVVPSAVGNYIAQVTITSNNYNTITETTEFSILKVDAKYSIVDVINVNLGSTYGDITFPRDKIGSWQLTDSTETVFDQTGIQSINVRFVPFEKHLDGYYSVNTTLYVNVVQNLDTLTDFNPANIIINDQTITVGRSMLINYRITSYNNVSVTFSLSQGEGYLSELNLEATSENVGTYTVWVKFELALYKPYFTHITLTIEE